MSLYPIKHNTFISYTNPKQVISYMSHRYCNYTTPENFKNDKSFHSFTHVEHVAFQLYSYRDISKCIVTFNFTIITILFTNYSCYSNNFRYL